MKRKTASIALLILPAAASLSAGTLSDGKWTPQGCGDRPEIPVIDGSSLDSYNSSVSVFNAWQKVAQAYNECLAREANADNALIANTANEEQAAFRKAIDKVNADADEIKKTLEGQ